MSSAALQSVPHSTVTVSPIGSHTSLPTAPTNRSYSATTSPSRDPYYNQAPAASTASPRPSRRPSANGATTQSPSQQPSFYSPTGSSTSNAAPITAARSAASTLPPPSPVAASSSQRAGPPVAPPRTSSNHRSTADRSSRRNGHSEDPTRMAAADLPQEHVERDRGAARHTNGAPDAKETLAAAAASATSRRRPQNPPEPSRSQSNGPTGEVLNQVVISKPEVDIERERQRMVGAESSTSRSGDATDELSRSGRSRHDHSSRREKTTKFGDYYLGNTLGEGEFGKVKMGWKQEGGVQVAIKLIRRDSVGSNPQRLNKIYREIAILREISHPYIVRLHEMVETDRYIGIILEYASGGELFDYILNHRYLKDNAARRLFAQLVSGVGYLHKKGIVHRDLKLENLLLDRNRNIIITDFGFANTFNPVDELGEEIEYNLHSKDYVKRMDLDKILPSGHRRGDLMQTSCGSPCYAAPELVVSDSLYTGRKVDVWSCGVILYAMLAGYLPFDDDPANPEGDNINLLYKYIVSTPLTFPEYVTPHARDLLRRILVPDPRKRADLFEVARHSWLSEYSSVVGFITSSTTTTVDIANTTVAADESSESPLLTRSASVREPSKGQKSPAPTVGDLARKQGTLDPESEDGRQKTNKDTKRRTVQVEYVDPKTHTTRGEPASTTPRSQARSGSGPVEVPVAQATNRMATDKALPREPSQNQSPSQNTAGQRKPSTAQRQPAMPPPSRSREQARAAAEATYVAGAAALARPATGGSMTSTASRAGSMILPTQKPYGQPVAPTVAGTNAQGHLSQPKSGKAYNISGSMSGPLARDEEKYRAGRPTTGNDAGTFGQVSRTQGTPPAAEARGHKRSNTIGGLSEKIFGRSGSIFGRSHAAAAERPKERPKKSYPPISMPPANMPSETPRQSTDSRRSFSLGFGRKRSGSIAGSQSGSTGEKTRRFSLLRAIGISKDDPSDRDDRYYDQGYDGNTHIEAQGPAGGDTSTPDFHASAPAAVPATGRNSMAQTRAPPRTAAGSQSGSYNLPPQSGSTDTVVARQADGTAYGGRPRAVTQTYATQYNDSEGDVRRPGTMGRQPARGVLQKNNRKFNDAWDQDAENYGAHNHAGSSGAARKVMDFFRRRGKARAGE